MRQAQELERHLNQREWRSQAQLTVRQAQVLEEIADGKPPRNAVAIMGALKLKVEHAYQKPKLEIDLTTKSHAELVAEAAGVDLGKEAGDAHAR